MGVVQSSSGGQVISKGGGSGAGPAQHQPPPAPPYPGPAPEYRFLNTEVANSARFTFGGAGSEMMSTNIDAYYPLLSSQYNENFKLMSFYKLPSEQRTGMFSTTVNIPYQGIFYRYPYRNEGWRLQIEKSVIEPHVQWNFNLFSSQGQGTVADSSHLIQSISNHSRQGGRLICMEVTGQQIAQGFSAQFSGRLPSVGVDVFYDMPTHPNPEIYTYQIMSVPIIARAGFGGITASCDWAGNLGAFLAQGWRLVEIFMDSGETRGKAFSMSMNINSIWIFEKLVSKMNDPTPVYQGTFIEHFVEVRGGFGGTHAQCGWEGKIQEMASYGWELACILQTPESQTRFAKITIKYIIFFQRRVIPQLTAPIGNQQAVGFQPPPAYDTLK